MITVYLDHANKYSLGQMWINFWDINKEGTLQETIDLQWSSIYKECLINWGSGYLTYSGDDFIWTRNTENYAYNWEKCDVSKFNVLRDSFSKRSKEKMINIEDEL